MSLFVDENGWGDWRLADNPRTRVTQEQVSVINCLGAIEDLGASEVRLDDEPGDLLVWMKDDRLIEVGPDGKLEEVSW